MSRWNWFGSAIMAGLLVSALGLGGISQGHTAAESPAPPLPRGYVCYRAATPIAIDGRITEDAWSLAELGLKDIAGGPFGEPRIETTTNGYEVSLPSNLPANGKPRRLIISHDARIRVE